VDGFFGHSVIEFQKLKKPNNIFLSCSKVAKLKCTKACLGLAWPSFRFLGVVCGLESLAQDFALSQMDHAALAVAVQSKGAQVWLTPGCGLFFYARDGAKTHKVYRLKYLGR
jgi:hypothetical protein